MNMFWQELLDERASGFNDLAITSKYWTQGGTGRFELLLRSG